MYARTFKCNTCTSEFFSGQCCSEMESVCGAGEFENIVTDITNGEAPGSNSNQIQQGPYRGQMDPCLNCQRYVDNDRASEPDCPGWAAMGGKPKEDISG